ncbi:nucleotide exchange factor GrpE [Propionibacteriaceae bacterium Y1700]|uniref:nucleotide exchange factor GrpE n=1 Tax=Microlunatus sp. Y1700 TaxID=3418487 RepID=UPI003DA6ED49
MTQPDDHRTDQDRSRTESAEEQNGPTIRDKRRIDPETYQVREPQTTAAPAPEAGTEVSGEVSDPVDDSTEPTEAAEVTELKGQVAERTADLQRLQAEYVNYKRRVDRDREVVKVQAVTTALSELLSVLDDIRSAREHEGELSGGFRAVADGVEKFATRHGVLAYGEPGDVFDPQVHEALMQTEADGITEPTCVQILQVGYMINDRVVRPARVAVAQPQDPAPSGAPE